MVQRRRFVKNMMVAVPAVMLAPGLFWFPQRADAVLPGIIARFLFGSLIRRGGVTVASRAVGKRIVTGTSSRAGQHVLPQGAAVASSSTVLSGASFQGLSFSVLSVSGVSVTFSRRIHAMSRQYAADIVWAKDSYINSFGYDIDNASNKDLRGSLDLFVKDVDSDRIVEQISLGVVDVEARRAFRYSFELEKFDYDGVIRLLSESSASELAAPPSGNIIIARSGEISIV